MGEGGVVGGGGGVLPPWKIWGLPPPYFWARAKQAKASKLMRKLLLLFFFNLDFFLKKIWRPCLVQLQFLDVLIGRWEGRG
jgi:hypothetical protein